MHSLNQLASKCITKLGLFWWFPIQFALKQYRWTKQSQIWYYLYFLKRMIEIVTSKCWIYYGTICPPISWKFSSAFYTQNYCLPHGCHAWYQDLLNQNLDCSIHCKNKKVSKIMSMILAIIEDPLNVLVFCWVKFNFTTSHVPQTSGRDGYFSAITQWLEVTPSWLGIIIWASG